MTKKALLGSPATDDMSFEMAAVAMAMEGSQSHSANTSNPHATTKAQVGLGNVDNTSDASKPVSSAQATANAVIQTDLNTHKSNSSNPHSVTKAQIGLGNVDNTSDVSKPISTATQNALDLKANLSQISKTFQSTVSGGSGIASFSLVDGGGNALFPSLQKKNVSFSTESQLAYGNDQITISADKKTLTVRMSYVSLALVLFTAANGLVVYLNVNPN